MHAPILYSFRRCPYAIATRLALLEGRVVCELREILLKEKPQQMLDASPKGTVPVLILPDGGVIDESLEIISWALEQSDPRAFLNPSAGSVDRMLSLMNRIEAEFKFHLDRYKYAERYERAEANEHRKMASSFLMELETRLQSQDFLFGNTQSMADIATLPFVRQFANTDRTWFAAQPWPKLIKWLNAFLESKEFLHVMQKHQQWRDGDEPIFLS